MIECVPNFSEGRDRLKLNAIVEAMASAPGVFVLGSESDQDHNRSVVTIAGDPQAVMESAIRGAGKAAELIDLREHEGVHPRVGATDVIPFIPLPGGPETLEQCAAIAHEAGEEIWKRYRIPVYFYEAAARAPERTRLENVRRNEFDGNPPDIGDVAQHETAGASVIGARKILIAYNINLNTPQVVHARAIAREIRESSGGFPHVKALGLYLTTTGQAQVSMNLTDFEHTRLDFLYEAVVEEASRHNCAIESCELIGLIPQKAFDMYPAFFQHAANFDESRIIEVRINQLLQSK